MFEEVCDTLCRRTQKTSDSMRWRRAFGDTTNKVCVCVSECGLRMWVVGIGVRARATSRHIPSRALVHTVGYPVVDGVQDLCVPGNCSTDNNTRTLFDQRSVSNQLTLD